MPRTVDQALDELFSPKPDYAALAAQNAFALKHYRAWTDAVTKASAKKPGPKPAAQLVKLLGDTPAVQLRHLVAEAHEELEAGEEGLQLALAAAACSPRWDPVFVAWSLRGVAFWLRRLGRMDEARAVLDRLWTADPWYFQGRAEAAAAGVKPPVPACPTGSADHLRLAGAQVLLEGFRPAHLRHIAMAVSLLWTKDFAAAARMANLAGKGTKYEGTWAADIAAFATTEAKRSTGNALPLPDAAWGARGVAVKDALKREDMPLLRALALDPSRRVMLAAWVALAKLGEGHEVRALLEELVAASTIGRAKTELCFELESALSQMPRTVAKAASAKAASRTSEAPKKAGGKRRTRPESPDAAALTALALASVERGAACSLSMETTKLGFRGVPPSLATWVAGGGGLDETKPSKLGALAKRAHGGQFAKLPAALATSRALPLELPEVVADTLEVLALDFADERGEAPVLALDVSDGAAVFVTASSFGAWIAANVGASPAAHDVDGIEQASARLFGGPPPAL